MNIFQQTNRPAETASLTTMIKEGALLLDVRTPGEFELGHVNGSVNIPLDRLGLSLAGLNKMKNIIVYCQSGGRSSMAKSILEQNGFTRVINGGTWIYVNQLLNAI